MALRLRGIISISLLAGLALSACTEPAPKLPTAAQVEPTLRSHIDHTVKNAFGADIKVTDPGGVDVPCANGRTKRTYGVSAVARVGSGDPEIITLALIGSLHGVAKYKLVSAPNPTTREAVGAQYHTRITLSSPSKGRMLMRGETECLPAT